ncbi:hypothetical protein MUK42_15942 [Musa troglodytarum]|uniref:DUF7036 domain-containing protein n=1 Tax=Musa troglodytarum TaxID=320322 RepID=A0A9E7L023_9LILI|nr:hypothetical protein MUK42_15942 [Musa troglodytarum]
MEGQAIRSSCSLAAPPPCCRPWQRRGVVGRWCRAKATVGLSEDAKAGGLHLEKLPEYACVRMAAAEIQASLVLQKPISLLATNAARLENDILEEIGIPNTKNVYVKLTNINGSTVTPPVTVEASVLSDMGSGSLLPDRMKQLAQVITRPNANNLGLNNSVFGKVKQVQLSSYLEHSLSMAPGPSPSGSPPVGNLYPEPPASLNPTLSPAPVPSDNHHRQPPCFCCHTFPIKNPMAYAPAPENGIQPDSQSASAPGPSRRNGDPFTNCFPCPSLAPNIGSSVHPYLPTLSGHLRHLASPPSLKAMGPTPKVHAKHSPSSPAASYASRPVQVSESGSRLSPATLLSYASSSLFSKAATYAFWEINLTRLLGLLIFQLVCGPR